MRVHSGVLPYPCEYPGCSKRFRWKSSLKPHVRVHLSEPPLNGVFTPSGGNILAGNITPVETLQERLAAVSRALQSHVGVNAPSPKPVFQAIPLNLPSEQVFTEAQNSPISIIPSSLSSICLVAKSETREDREGREYMCTFPDCKQTFPRLSSLLEHEKISFHEGSHPSIARALFHNPENRHVEGGEIDLSCDSVLSRSQGSVGTEGASFTMVSSVEDLQAPMVNVTDLWESDLDIVDPLLEVSEGFESEKAVDMLSGDCQSGTSMSKEQDTECNFTEARWKLGVEGNTKSTMDFSFSF